MEVFIKHNVVLTAVGVYSVNTKNDKAAKMRDDIYKAALAHEFVNQVHAFYVNDEKKSIRFDAVISLDATDRKAVYTKLKNDIETAYPDYSLQLAMDTDFT